MTNPYKIAGPALVSFSGGRTSGYMLHEILAAYDGHLPGDVHIVFANTGKEREETLRFVHDCQVRWRAPIRWLEYDEDPDGKPTFREVSHNSASRKGEPFEQVIRRKKYLPNAVTRFCTIELKIRTMSHFMMAHGYKHWNNVVGLRYDEGRRVLKALERNDSNKERFKTVMPLSTAKVTKPDVMAFWRAQPFDLQLKPYEGNCDLCFLKSRKALENIMHEQPGSADWWVRAEQTVGASKPSGARFVTEYSYRELAETARRQMNLFEARDEPGVECGFACGEEETDNEQ